jgi:hypothetical protein
VTIDTLALAFGGGDDFSHRARAVKVQIWVQKLPVEPVYGLGVLAADMPPANVFANHGAVLGFHQAIVIGMARPRLGLFDPQFVE